MSVDLKAETVQAELNEYDITRGKVSKKGIVLRPQPTNDPNEPLNWTQGQKYSTYVICCFFTFLAFMNSSAFTVAIQPIIKEFHVTPTEASYLTSLQVLGMGFGALVLMPLARLLGKRPVYLLSILFLCVTNIWSYFSHSYGSLLASRIIGGLMTAAADAFVPSLVADLFYFHERGRVLMIFHVAISTGAFAGPFINAYITQYAGWRWMCGTMAIAAAATFLVGSVTIRETHYAADGHRDLLKPEDEYASKRSWTAELSLTRGFDRDESFFGWMLRTISLILYPPVWVVGLTVGLFIGCNIALQITSTQTFTAAPYHWQLHSLGLLSLAGLVGAIISFVFGGWLIDFIATKLTARNAEHVEPEYRLPAMIIPAVIGPMGVLTFGMVIANGKS